MILAVLKDKNEEGRRLVFPPAFLLVFPGIGEPLRTPRRTVLSSIVKHHRQAIDPVTAKSAVLFCSNPGGRPVESSRKTPTADRAWFVNRQYH
jgi:hypothetical protein